MVSVVGEDKFTYEVMVQDLRDNSKRIVAGGYVKIKNINSVRVNIVEGQEFKARVTKPSYDQYAIRIFSGLLVSCYEFLDVQVRSYYKTIAGGCRFTEEAFLRMVGGCMTETIFWHEFSHMARGHWNYNEDRKEVWADREIALKDARMEELDADIYAASFLFSRVYGVYVGSKGRYSLQMIMQAYSVGIRSLFEVLHLNNEYEDELHEGFDHPHSLARAYAAVSFGLTSPAAEKTGVDADVCRAYAIQELLRFESSQSVTPVSVAILDEYFKKELSMWVEWSEVLKAYILLEVHPVPLLTKLSEHYRRIGLLFK